jgi:glycine cleavage system aminomethyltransferase T/glycine/D-amino acid oxidase-like deaminating enzyme
MIPAHARLVIIGAGIAGCSAAYHLARLGWREVVVVDQGPLFHTGGSTSHAPGGLSLVAGSRLLTGFASYSLPLYASLEADGRRGAHLVGALEVARSEERWQELKRRAGWGKSFGVQGHLLTPDESARLVPVLNSQAIVGGFHSPGAGIGDPVTAAEALARGAMAAGAASFHGHTQVTGIEVQAGRVRAVAVRGPDGPARIAAEAVLICAGIWGPLVGRLAGITVPLMPMEHQYVKVGPVPELAALGREIALPIVRVHDHLMYCRMHGADWGMGNYNHIPLPVAPEHIRPYAEHDPDPSKNAFTPEHFAEPFRQVAEVFPFVAGKPITESFNGMFAFTPDGMPLLGPHPAVAGLWLAEAIWITHAGGAGRAIAEWMTHGAPGVDAREADISRFHAHALTPSYIRARGEEAYKNTHLIIHPAEPTRRPRGLRHTPLHARYAAQQGCFIEFGGWERAAWCEANAGLPRPDWPARTGWAARYWSPIQGQEHLAVRAAAALFDMSTFTKIEVEGPGALELMQWVFSNQMDVRAGRVVYTLMLEVNGGIRSDMTVVRLGPERFRILAGAAAGPRDLAWLRRQAAERGSPARITDVTPAYAALGLWGPRARAILAAAAPEDDLSNAGFPYYTARSVTVGSAPCLALRVSYVGELGWEIYAPAEYALHVWEAVWQAGQPHGLIAAGVGAMDSLRIEKGYRRLGADMDGETTPREAGMEHVVRMGKGDFVGRAALLERNAQPPRRKLACLTLDRPGDVVLGREPILVEGRPAGYVTSANTGYSVGRHVAYGLLPVEAAETGRGVEIEYFGERLPATVQTEPLFDPEGKRLRA